MVNSRLQYFAEKHDILKHFQLGFRKGRGTIDNIVILENDILKHLETGVKSLAVFVDLEKAYDLLRIISLLSKLHSTGLRGNILNFIKNFLINRTFQVKVGNEKSDSFTSENGLPQGSILSPILFNFMIHDIPKCKSVNVNKLLYADDCVIWTHGLDMKEMSLKIQTYLTELNNWFNLWGLRISHQKTTPILFSRGRKEEDFRLFLGDHELKNENQYRYLGVIFDKSLTWRPHLQDVALRCKKKLNVLKALTHSKFCQSIQDLIRIYRSLIRSLIDYACEAYDSASKSAKRVLDSVQYQALKICSLSKQGTSLKTLLVEFGEMPLEIRREMLTIRLRKRVESMPNHPMKSGLTPCWQFDLCKISNSREPFGLRSQNLPGELKQSIECNSIPPNLPFWKWQLPYVSTTISKSLSKSDNPAFLKQYSLEIINTRWTNYLHIYTDGSKDPASGKVAAAFYVPYFKYKEYKRMKNDSSVYRSELAAIILALNWAKQLHDIIGVVIFSDSLSALQSIKAQNEDNFIVEILTLCTHLHYKGISINLEWIPGHCDISGNEVADTAAKHALHNTVIDIENKLNKNEFNYKLKQYCYNKWQYQWENKTISPLKALQQNVRKPFQCFLKNRRAESIIHCLRMSNISLNESLLKVNMHETGLCEFCPVPETIQHFLCFCPKYIIARTMMLAETETHENDILNLLTSSNPSHQRALVNFVLRSQRLVYY